MKSIKEIFNGISTITDGVTNFNYIDGLLSISHIGNIGDTILRTINPELIQIGLPTVRELRDKYEVVLESGSIEFMWNIIFYLKK